MLLLRQKKYDVPYDFQLWITKDLISKSYYYVADAILRGRGLARYQPKDNLSSVICSAKDTLPARTHEQNVMEMFFMQILV